MPRFDWRVSAGQAGVIIAIVGAWELAGALSPPFRFAAGRPTEVVTELWLLLWRDKFYMDIFVTSIEAFTGIALGTALGCALGLSLWYSRYASEVLRPLIVSLGAFPILALAPLMILWFGVGLSMKIALAVISTFFVSIAQSFRGAREIRSEHLEFLQGMGATKYQLFRKVVVPGSLEAVFGAMRLAIGLGLLGAFVGEFIASDQGVGRVILRASSLYQSSRAMAASLSIVFIALCFDYLGMYIETHRARILRLVSVPSFRRRNELAD